VCVCLFLFVCVCGCVFVGVFVSHVCVFVCVCVCWCVRLCWCVHVYDASWRSFSIKHIESATRLLGYIRAQIIIYGKNLGTETNGVFSI